MNDPMESERPEWQCESCETFWGANPDAQPCEVPGCSVIACGDCFHTCFSCDLVLCKTHSLQYHDGRALEHVCPSCFVEATERDAEERDVA